MHDGWDESRTGARQHPHQIGFNALATLGAAETRTIALTLNAPMGKRLVEVTLAPGEILSFNLNYLVAFSRSVRLWTAVEFSWASFGTDRNFIQNASGPGILVFELNGEETQNAAAAFQFAPSRLVAWSPATEFTFCGIESVWDIYLNEIMIRANQAAPGTLILLDADAEDSAGAGSRVRNVLKLLKRVYIPI